MNAAGILDDIICAPASGSGGAIGIVRVSGNGCLQLIDTVIQFRNGNAAGSPGFRVKFGLIPELDEVLVSIFRAPHSYTGEDMAEINCHASPYIIEEVIGRLCLAGCRIAGPGEFTRRAF
ncbi:MAG: tRNA uridine-5-carboxymethylaminomethyl(34) synthesis GTPase MnmE, partial [Bacteroidales bacterium]|nr:tRNA uridine-5-carboxymethylaminomethyl(34) synthesis GTPase MnmE [Bacteroidales bacterium]